MADLLRLRIHVAEPFDFERENPSSDLFGTTADDLDEDAEEWLVELESSFTFHEDEYASVLVAPRYVGEKLGRVFDSILGFPVRIAHRTEDGWHYAMTGMISLAPPPESGTERPDDKEDPI